MILRYRCTTHDGIACTVDTEAHTTRFEQYRGKTPPCRLLTEHHRVFGPQGRDVLPDASVGTHGACVIERVGGEA